MEQREKTGPFPEIPRFPEEPKLSGAPHEAHESELLAQEEALPLLYEAGEDVKQFKAQGKREKQRAFQANKSEELLANPERFEEYFDTLHILEERWEDKKKEVHDYESYFSEQLERYAHERGTYNPDILNKWLHLSIKSNVYGEEAKRILRGLYTRGREPKDTINFLYDFSLAILESEDQEIMQEGSRMLCWGTDVFSPGSLGQKNYTKALFASDDGVVKKHQEVDAVVWYLGQKYATSEYAKMNAFVGEYAQTEEFRKTVEEAEKRDPRRVRKMVEYIQGGEQVRAMPPEKEKAWPYSLTFQGGPLRKRFNEFVALEDEQKASISLPFRGSMLVDSSRLAAFILEDLAKEGQGPYVLAERDFVASIFYLAPELIKEEREALASDNIQLRKEIVKELTHLISPRGDKIIISDPELHSLGFRSILFEIGEPRTRTNVTIEVGKYQFQLELDEDLGLYERATGKRFPVGFSREAFLEQVILSHLKELQCTERAIAVKPEGGAQISAQEQEEEQKKFYARRAHLRKLPPGQGYTDAQRERALELEKGRIDLHRINAELGLTKETGQKTYVKAIDIKGGDPIISRAPHAMERFQRMRPSKK